MCKLRFPTKHENFQTHNHKRRKCSASVRWKPSYFQSAKQGLFFNIFVSVSICYKTDGLTCFIKLRRHLGMWKSKSSLSKTLHDLVTRPKHQTFPLEASTTSLRNAAVVDVQHILFLFNVVKLRVKYLINKARAFQCPLLFPHHKYCSDL